ncbi:MAG: ATP-dependent DNA helicase [Lachnospiraceae bacterium]|nr:ATP-dependent DNA helicase [Lachnospiraceae bacterium]
METIQISVRALVEFLLRSGDLDNRTGGWADKEAMQKGSRIHRKIQKRMGGDYQAEVALSYEKTYEHFLLKVDGRADGIFVDDGIDTIDEIKGTYLPLDKLEEPVPVHLAQAKCYAYIYGLQNQKETMKITMTYVSLETEEVKRFPQIYQMSQLDVWFHGMLDEYYKWADFQYEWHQTRNISMVGLEFPFPYREGQKKLVGDVYRTILREKQLFVNAPTGVGKTLSTIFPAVRAVGEGKGDKIFYLTAKTITRTVAEEAFQILREKGLRYKAITLTSKEKMCVCDEVDCNPVSCPRAKGHFDRVNEAVFSLLQDYDIFSREMLLEKSREWEVCPYEMQLDIATWVDAVICDYNYVFDPVVRLRRFFGEGVPKGNHIFLIDEAHNLVDRGREMFSAEICKEDFLEMKRLLKPYPLLKKLPKALEKCNRQLLVYKRECEQECTEMATVGDFILSMLNLCGELEELLQEQKEGELRKKALEFYFQVRAFINIYELLDDNYLIYTRHTASERFILKLFCVNPAVNLQECLNRGRSTVFFSATLLPVQYYKKMFSTNPDDYATYAQSPFDPDNRKLLISREVSTRYTRRGVEEYTRIAGCIYRVIREKRGNYLIFFPSYRFLEDVAEVFVDNYQKKLEERGSFTMLRQQMGMSEQEREEFLKSFETAEKGNETGTEENTLAGFCVMGGIFSEGIDLDGERLIGAVVVGTGIPQVNAERELLKKYFDRHGENGFNYAYRFPGMNKVLQSAGRVIRTMEDRGVIILLDERFAQWEYRQLFPVEWADARICSQQEITRELQEFWKCEETSTVTEPVDEGE